MRVILLGPPGAGKGTQAARVSGHLGIPRISSGDLFRDHQQRDTRLGRLARSYMERGALVPDGVTIEMVMEWINSNAEGTGFLLDGFPRTIPQAQALDEALAERGGLDTALLIKVSKEELVGRLTGRLICRNCQTPFHREYAPPDRPGKCNMCGGELYQRDDDKPAAVGKRVEVYLEETEPLVEYYGNAGILHEVDGEGTVENVGRALVDVLS